MYNQKDLENLIIKISKKLGLLTGLRVYVAVVDPNGQILAFQDGISPFKKLIENFTNINFPYLKFGDHSIPLSGNNLIFFKTNNCMIALYGPKGKYGQLLVFKSQFETYSSQIDNLIGIIKKNMIVPKELAVTKKIRKFKYKRERWNIIPTSPIKLTGKEKLSLIEGNILNICDGKNTIRKISVNLEENVITIVDNLINFYHNSWIRFPNFYPTTITCPKCKRKHHLFIPKLVYSHNPSNYIRVQMPSEVCGHTFTVFLDKDMQSKIQTIDYFKKFKDEIDFLNLSIESLLTFFGQDVFSNIFHTLILKKSIIIIEKEKVDNITALVAEFLIKIFPNLEYGKDVRSISPEQYKKEWKKLKDRLIIDVESNIVINEPYEREKFEAIAEILTEILKEKDEKRQILKLNQEIERIILLAEPVINVVNKQKGVIVEGDLIKKIKDKYKTKLRIHEIPLIKKLTKAYLNEDISRKIVSELAYSIW